MTQGISRRRFIAASALASTAFSGASQSQPTTRGTTGVLSEESFAKGAWCHWLDDQAPAVPTGVTWGMPWPRSKHSPRTPFSLRDREAIACRCRAGRLRIGPTVH